MSKQKEPASSENTATSVPAPQASAPTPNNPTGLTVRPPSAPLLQRDVPDFIPINTRGLEDAEITDFTIPRLAICQSLSPQRDKEDGRYIKGLEEGMMFNTVTSEIYPEFLTVVPIFFFRTRLYFAKMEEGGGLQCQSLNGKDGGVLSPTCDACEHSKWHQSEPPRCYLMYNYASLLPFTGELVSVSMKSSATKVAKNWNALMRMRQRDIFAGRYRFMTVSEKNGNNKWYQWQIRPDGWVDEVTFRLAEGLYQSLQTKQIKVDTSGLEQREPGADQDL